jgi:hypothetical protein
MRAPTCHQVRGCRPVEVCAPQPHPAPKALLYAPCWAVYKQWTPGNVTVGVGVDPVTARPFFTLNGNVVWYVQGRERRVVQGGAGHFALHVTSPNHFVNSVRVSRCEPCDQARKHRPEPCGDSHVPVGRHLHGRLQVPDLLWTAVQASPNQICSRWFVLRACDTLSHRPNVKSQWTLQ